MAVLEDVVVNFHGSNSSASISGKFINNFQGITAGVVHSNLVGYDTNANSGISFYATEDMTEYNNGREVGVDTLTEQVNDGVSYVNTGSGSISAINHIRFTLPAGVVSCSVEVFLTTTAGGQITIDLEVGDQLYTDWDSSGNTTGDTIFFHGIKPNAEGEIVIDYHSKGSQFCATNGVRLFNLVGTAKSLQLPKTFHPDFSIPNRKPTLPAKSSTKELSETFLLGGKDGGTGLTEVGGAPDRVNKGFDFVSSSADFFRYSTALDVTKSATYVVKFKRKTGGAFWQSFLSFGYSFSGTIGFCVVMTGTSNVTILVGAEWTAIGGGNNTDVERTAVVTVDVEAGVTTIYMDGGTRDTVASVPTSAIANNIILGARHSGVTSTTDAFNGEIYFAQAIQGCVPESLAWELTRNPYALLEPVFPASYFHSPVPYEALKALQLPSTYSADFTNPKKKPTGKVELDPTHPLSQRVISYALHRNSDRSDLVSGNLLTNEDGTDIVYSVQSGQEAIEGKGGTGTTHLVQNLLGTGAARTKDFTILTSFRIDDGSHDNALFAGATSGIPLQRYLWADISGGTDQRISMWTNSGFAGGTNDAVKAGQVHFVGARFDETGGNVSAYLDRTKTIDTSIGFSAADIDRYTVGGASGSSSRNLEGAVFYTIVIEGLLTDAEILSFEASPYQLLRPALPALLHHPELSGPVPVTGTAAPTQEDDTSAATGTVTGTAITGTLAVTTEDDTSAATGQVGAAITGSLAVTQADQSPAAEGQVGLNATGTLASTQDPQTSAVTGQVGLTVTGSSANTQEDNTSAISGQVGLSVTGSLAETQDTQTVVSTGQVGLAVTASAAVTQEDQTSSGSGVIGDDLVGTLAVTQEEDTVVSSGSVGGGVSGSAATTQDSDTAVASGLVLQNITGTAASTQDSDTASGAGLVLDNISGSADITQDDQTCVATGLALVFVTGAGAMTEDDHIATISGIVAPHVTGSISVAQGFQVCVAQGQNGEIEEGVGIRDGIALPEYIDQGMPYAALGILAVDTVSGIHHVDQGMPFTDNGRIAADIGGVVSRIESAGTPFTAAGRVAMGTGGIDHVSAGVGYTVFDQISIINS